MNITVTLPEGLSERERTHLARGFLRGVVAVNRLLLRLGYVPSLYNSGVVYGDQVDAEEFADALTCFRRGIGDCAHLACWRCAELQEQHAREVSAGRRSPNPHPDLRLYVRNGGPEVLVHVQVRHHDGQIEDPSRFLGMAELNGGET